MKVTGFSRVSKDLTIAQIEKELKDRPFLCITQHGTLSAPNMDALRTKLRASNSRYFVVKNSLGRIALERANLKSVADGLTGACGIVFSSGDPAQSSKTLIDFAKNNETFKIQSGYMNGNVISTAQIKILAELPSREVLLGKIAGGMQAPISRFVGVLAGTMRKMVTVLDAIAKKKNG